MVKEAHRRGESLTVPRGAVLTPAAKDALRALHVTLAEEEPAQKIQEPSPMASRVPRPFSKKVALGSDHAGFPLKEILKTHLEKSGYAVLDCGTFSEEPVDYPDIALSVSEAVASGQCPRGIIIDGAGIGAAIAANKVPGIRAALCHDLYTARNSRLHNDANVLTLGGRVIGSELAKEIVQVWLETDFGGGRHRRRVEKILQIERQHWQKK